MKYISIFIIFLSIGCNKRSERVNSDNYTELVFNNDSFKEKFIKIASYLDTDIEGADRSLILEYYIDPYQNYDTIISIRMCPPTELRNLQQVSKYNGRNVYIYYTENLKPILKNFIQLSNKPLDSVSLKPVPNEYECIYRKSFILNKNEMKPYE